MYTITVTESEEGQRLDRFLKKYLTAAPLSLIYRLIRKDVKVGGKRVGTSYMLNAGDLITIYMRDEQIEELIVSRKDKSDSSKAKRKFGIIFEDDNILVVAKPFGLLTHGDRNEKKETLANQIIGYLLEQGSYRPDTDRMFTPSPVNRLDRNTSGIVVFGKNPKAIRDFSKMFATAGCVEKQYLALVAGKLREELHLKDRILKDGETNKVSVLPEESGEGKPAETIADPIENIGPYTMVSVKLVTGRPHQIRAHLSEKGFPLIGDVKYGDKAKNALFTREYGLSAQFLHADSLKVIRGLNTLEYLSGKEFLCPLPQRLEDICEALRKKYRKVSR